MGQFHSTFSSVGNKHDFSPEAWRVYFDPSRSKQWEEDIGGAIQFLNENEEQYSISMNYNKEKGISISYDRYNKSDFSRNFSMISQSSEINKEGFDVLDNGASVPRNSYISWGVARAVVEDFLCNPERQSKSVNWIDAKHLDWPEDY
ncbi:hypothetical protein G6M04_25540 [Agrobacterium rhizogenes]|uniref:hypothetical protein n=1 Tax=Rhizobium rhizogenes TaxID=359 RepID=UPI001573FEBA|nr:hypothetical protein [Rhizobium rhizogenes]NTG50759.1 hypothetical protein [Rhizobium rhizogenes]